MKIFKHEKYSLMAQKEAECLMKINHPNSVKILEYGNKGYSVDCKLNVHKTGLSYILMEYVTGGCLDEV